MVTRQLMFQIRGQIYLATVFGVICCLIFACATESPMKGRSGERPIRVILKAVDGLSEAKYKAVEQLLRVDRPARLMTIDYYPEWPSAVVTDRWLDKGKLQAIRVKLRLEPALPVDEQEHMIYETKSAQSIDMYLTLLRQFRSAESVVHPQWTQSSTNPIDCWYYVGNGEHVVQIRPPGDLYMLGELLYDLGKLPADTLQSLGGNEETSDEDIARLPIYARYWSPDETLYFDIALRLFDAIAESGYWTGNREEEARP